MLSEWIINTLNAFGYPGIVLLMFLENVFPPIPSEIIMPLAGFMTTKGKLSFVGVVISGMIGSVLGALPLYYLGKLVGEQRLKVWANKYGKYLTASGKDIEKAKDWFDRHGSKAVFICRLVPGLRSLISIPAGFASMNIATFLLYSALGTGLWAALLAYLGRMLGENYELVDKYLSLVVYIVLGIIVTTCTVWIVIRKKQGAITEGDTYK